MQSSKVLRSLSSSSRAWLARQNSDPYVKKRYSNPTIYRCRAAYKLVEIDNEYKFLSNPNIRAVVDLGAAPGGWSQVVAERLGWLAFNDIPRQKPIFAYGEKNKMLIERHGTWSSRVPEKLKGKGTEPAVASTEPEEVFDPLNIDNDREADLPQGRGAIIAVDLKSMEPIHGVLDIRGNFLKGSTQDQIRRFLNKEKGSHCGKADVILSDMAGNFTGKVTRDTETSLNICKTVFEFAAEHLRKSEEGRLDGVLLIKYFSHPRLYEFRDAMLKPNFHNVRTVKPKASRKGSKEFYFLCRGWKGCADTPVTQPDHIDPDHIDP